MTWFQRLLLATILATLVLVAIGGTVRATDSGLGCPDWPTCHGELIPPAEYHTLIEFSHRTAATVVGVLFLGVTFFAFKTERKHPRVFWLAFAAGIVLAIQIVLGGITVKRELPTEIVATHLGTAMVFLGLLIVTLIASIAISRGVSTTPRAGASAFTRLAVGAAALTFGTLVLGSYISGHEASLACREWPQCGGSVLGDGGQPQSLHMLHRLVAGALGILLLGVLYQAFALRLRERGLLALAAAACALYLTQAMIGAMNIWTELADGVVILHLTLAALLWAAMVLIVALSYFAAVSPESADERSEGATDPSKRKVAEWAR